MKTIAKNFGPGGCLPPIVKPGVKPNVKDPLEFALKDKDGNGSVNAQEFMAGVSRKENLERLQQFKRYDSNGDGQLSKDEFVRGRQMDRLRESLESPKVRNPQPRPIGMGAGEKAPDLLQKLFKGLAFTNPITMPFALGNWIREKIAG